LPAGRAIFIIIARIWMDFLALLRFLSEGKRKDAWAVSRAHQNFVWRLLTGDHRKASSSLQKANRKLRTKHYPLKGIYNGSLVWAFFVKKKMHFTDLDPADFL